MTDLVTTRAHQLAELADLEATDLILVGRGEGPLSTATAQALIDFMNAAGVGAVAAETAEAWAEGVEPGGPGTKSAKGHKEDAATSATAAATARDLSQQWASEDEDTEVAGGEFSAKHYAAKAAGAVAGVAALPGQVAILEGFAEKLSLTGELGLPSDVTPVTGSAANAGWYVLDGASAFERTYTQVWGFNFANRTYNLAAVDRDPETGALSNPTNATSFTTTAGNNPFSNAIALVVPPGKYPAIQNPSTSLSTAAGAAYVGYYGPGASFPFIDTTLFTANRLQLGLAYTYQAVTADVIAELADKEARLARLEGAFDLSDPPSVNLFDRSLCIDNQYHTTNNGGSQSLSFPGRIDLGAQALEPGKTYIWRIHDEVGFAVEKRLICRNAAGAYLGYSSGAGVAPNPPTVTVIDERTLKIEMPETTLVRFGGQSTRDDLNHTTEDFERIRDSIMLHEGEEPLPFEPPAPFGWARLKHQNLPPKADPEDEPEPEVFPGTVKDTTGWVEKAGNRLFVRTWYSATHDLVQYVSLVGGTSSEAKVVNLGGTRLVPRDLTNTQGGFNVSTLVVGAQNDDVGPYNYGPGYFGGNHGLASLRLATLTPGQGRTMANSFGSRWVDGAGRHWTVMNSPGTNQLHFLSDNQATYPAWSFRTDLAPGTLTHVSGASLTTSIVISAVGGAQLYPAINSQDVDVSVDGVLMTGDFAMPFQQSVVVGETYNISNPASILALAQANAGSATVPDYSALGVASDMSVNMSYAWAVNGALVLPTGGHTINQIPGFIEFTMTQAVGLTVGGSDTRHMHVRGLDPFTIGSNTYDFEAGQDITAPIDILVEFSAARWSDGANPPNAMSQIILDSGGDLKHSFTQGLNEQRGMGKASNRVNWLSRAGYVKNDGHKMYTGGIDAASSGLPSTLPANFHFDALVYRVHTLPDAPAPVFFWYPVPADEREVFVKIEWPANLADDVTAQRIEVPARFTGRRVEVVEEWGGAVLHTRDTVLGAGLSASCTGGGGIKVKLT